MPLQFGPNTPGTLIILGGAILLALATISTPIIKSFFFLNIQLNSKIPIIPLEGNIRLGTFGYCLQLESQLACANPKLGYQLNINQLGISLPTQIDLTTLNPIISKLTIALILHPIAAGLALLSALLGLVSHIREYSRSYYTSCLSSLASTAALLAFVLDIVVFSIAKNRLNAISDSTVAVSASLGNAIWITLAGWLCLTLSGFFFCAGRCLFARRHRAQAQADHLRPEPDLHYTKQMRNDAHQAEKARQQDALFNNHQQHGQPNLPAFAEYHNQFNNQEHIPLNRFNPHEDEILSSDHQRLLPSPDDYPSVTLNGVGMGYHHYASPPPLRPPPQPLAHHPSVSSRPSVYSDTETTFQQHHTPGGFIPPLPPIPSHVMAPPQSNNNNHHNNGLYRHLSAHVSSPAPATPLDTTPHRTPSSITYHRRLPDSLIPGAGMISRHQSHVSISQHQSHVSYTPPSSSSQSGTATRQHSLDDGPAGYLRKPYDAVVDAGQQDQYGGYASDTLSDIHEQPGMYHKSSMDSEVLSNHHLSSLPLPHDYGVASYHPTAAPHPGDPHSQHIIPSDGDQTLPYLAQDPAQNNNPQMNPYAHQFDDRRTLYSQTSSATVQAPGQHHGYAQ
ncbi:hypothetical protein PCANC_15497 [Puccinia coronata f. sp. avenae]|uniref:Pali-domain-containing protein n=1 Tax=Puccinia coronata f. sp. avenae TaxID=200324 RepID=A0A2N5UFP8_9BASI|nr:hypothetical protein PCANC_15497 [Puccinia coronata f. sp. avenae]